MSADDLTVLIFAKRLERQPDAIFTAAEVQRMARRIIDQEREICELRDELAEARRPEHY